MQQLKQFLVKRYRIIFIVVLVLTGFFYQYQKVLFYPPQSIHAWRQSLCASLTLNYYKHDMRFFQPEVHLLISEGGKSGNTSASEIPIFYYFVAALYKVFGVNEFLMRLVNMLIFFSGLYYLFRLFNKLLDDVFLAGGLTLLFFSSPLLIYYANNYITNASALAFSIIGLFHFFSYSLDKKPSRLWYSALFFLLAGSFKITGLFMVFAILGLFIYETLFPVFQKRIRTGIFEKGISQILPFIIILFPIFLWIGYAKHYNALHDSAHFSTTTFPIWNYSFNEIRDILHEIRMIWMPSYYNIFTLILIGLLSVYTLIDRRKTNPVFGGLTVMLLPVLVLYVLLQFWTFKDHDYHKINLFILVIMIFATASTGIIKRFPKTSRNYFFRSFLAAFILFNMFYARVEYGKRYQEPVNANTKFLAYRQIKPKFEEYGILPQDTVILLPGGDPLPLYLVDMVGWTAYVDPKFGKEETKYYNYDPDGLRESINKGARYLFILGIDEIYRQPWLREFTNFLVGKQEDLYIFDLRSDEKNFNPSERSVHTNLNSGMEKLSEDGTSFLTTVDSVFLEYGLTQSPDRSLDGLYSSKLTALIPFSLTVAFPEVHVGESFHISAWIFDPSDQCHIISSGQETGDFYENLNLTEVEDSLGWRKKIMEFFVPEKLEGKDLKVYLYYTGSDSAYVDKFKVIRFNQPLLN